jgi:anaerobic selenocysteine-containing dehydrogenase
VRCATTPAGKAMPDDKIVDELARTMNIRLKKRFRKRTAKRTKKTNPSKVSKKYPLTLIVRKNTYGYRNKILSAVLKGFDRLRGDRCIWMNERTAAKYRLKEGMEATLTGPYGAHTACVKISSSVPDDAVLIYSYQSNNNFVPGPAGIECTRS